MREMIYRNLSSPDRRQKDLTLAEIREDEGVVTQLEKRYTYRVKNVQRASLPEDVLPFPAPNPVDVWELRSNPDKSRHIFVRKSRDSQDGFEQFTYKIVGSFYAVQGDQIFLVIYRHILHMVVSDHLPGEENNS